MQCNGVEHVKCGVQFQGRVVSMDEEIDRRKWIKVVIHPHFGLDLCLNGLVGCELATPRPAIRHCGGGGGALYY